MPEFSDSHLRSWWVVRGGTFYGPKVEHADIKESDFLPLMREMHELLWDYRQQLQAELDEMPPEHDCRPVLAEIQRLDDVLRVWGEKEQS